MLPVIVTAAAVGAAVGWLAATSLPPHSFEHDREVSARLRALAFGDAVSTQRRDHPAAPRTIEFPEIAGNPVLWDFTLHSVLRRERRAWTWGDTAYAAAAPSCGTVTTAGTAITMSPGVYYFTTSVPALSGGTYP